MTGQRRALIVGTERYDAPGFTQLAAPAHDAQALHDVLVDPAVGDFEVTVLRNPTTQEARIAIETFFVEVKRDDLLLMHFSCHGVKSPEGDLYLAMRDTLPDRLAATGLPADFVNRLMASSRAQQIALFLDCCFGGAFHRGMTARASGSVNVKDAFQRQEGVRAGRARVVVAAAGDVQYALEGGRLVDHRDQPSVFTGVVVEALSTGKADRDGDGWVGIYELFDYVSDHVAELTTDQTPELSTFGTHGDMLLAHSQAQPVELDEELTRLLGSSLTSSRLEGIAELRSRVLDVELGQAAAAWRELERRSDADARTDVRRAAADAMAAATLRVAAGPVRLDAAGATVVAIDGPPLARQVHADSDAAWLAVEVDGGRLLLSVREGWAPGEHATVTVTGPTGSARLEVLPPSAPGTPPARRRHPSRRVLVGAGAAVVVLAVVIGAVIWRLPEGADDGPGQGGTLPQGAALADGALLWTVTDGDSERIQVGSSETSAETLSTLGSSVTWPTLTEDRRTVLYLSHDADSDRDSLWVAGSGGEDPRRLVDDPSCPSAGRPSVSPDGSMVALACRALSSDDSNFPGLRIYSVDGTLLRTLDRGTSPVTPTWTADGRSLVYGRQIGSQVGDKPATNLYVVAAGDENAVPRRLTSGPFRDELPVVTPDRTTMVFVRHTAAVEEAELYLMELDVDGVDVSPLAPAQRMAASDEAVVDSHPTLSPAGTGLRFVKDGVVQAADLEVGAESAPVTGLPTDVNRISWTRR